MENTENMDGLTFEPVSELVEVYGFDQEGYYSGLTVWQKYHGELLRTETATPVKPWGEDEGANHLLFYRWDGAKWIEEPKPTKPADLVGVRIEGFSPHAQELRALAYEFAKVDGFELTETDDGALVLTGLTEAQKMALQIQAEMEKYEAKVKELNYLIGLAVLANDEEEIASLRAEYAQLQEEE